MAANFIENDLIGRDPAIPQPIIQRLPYNRGEKTHAANGIPNLR